MRDVGFMLPTLPKQWHTRARGKGCECHRCCKREFEQIYLAKQIEQHEDNHHGDQADEHAVALSL